jgi:hypothetical protein
MPLMRPESTEALPFVSNVPFALSRTVRAEVIDAPACKAPPLNVRPPDASPSAASLLMLTVPELMSVPPV